MNTPTPASAPASWVIVSKATGKAIFEIFEKPIGLDPDKYDVIPIGEYLASLNKK